MELVERIQYIMKLNQMSASVFADEIGVQRSSVSHVLSGRNKPSLEFVQKIIKRFPKVDTTWLIEGTTNIVSLEDKMKLPEEKSNSVQSISHQTISKPEEIDEKPEFKSAKVRKISRILVFYDDNTFEEFNPNSDA
ncbi:MAG: XRE family transcriptional regulator [Bacteroidetes bacterium]|nr:MAG: XRE family transcriptional regulator [Bacteroidota bacterium]MBL1145272.1 XRE family transcriptional regulator [Bacteroidota bacterium]MCB0803846.1 helix-turn-helix transcriptional regulator [Flavobacteriales bacterium]NOG58068.1 helix-turn-helix transcriptional regulator [Bacteroidota bacterium]